jgi:hypothetical protein
VSDSPVSLQRLGETLAARNDDRPPVIRLGIVDSVDTGPPVTVTIGGRPMRCLACYPTPTAGDVVAWLDDLSRAVALGPLL